MMTAGAKSDGQLVRDLSLAECYAYDPNPSRRGTWTRFKCCRHGGDQQQSLAVDEHDTGKFRCWNGGCLIWGTVTEKQPDRDKGRQSTFIRREPPLPKADPLEPNDVAVRRAVTAWKQFAGSPAQEYARVKRGVPDELAASLHLGYWRGTWGGIESEWLTFPLRCPVNGRPVAIYGRNLHSDHQADKARVLGQRGLFGATAPGPLPEDLILVEGAFEVLAILASPGLPPPRAVIGASARAEWFDECRRVTILFDDDENGEGQKGAARLVEDLKHHRCRRGDGPRVLMLKSGALRAEHGVKDLGELLKRGIAVSLPLPPLPGAPERANHDSESSLFVGSPDQTPSVGVPPEPVEPSAEHLHFVPEGDGFGFSWRGAATPGHFEWLRSRTAEQRRAWCEAHPEARAALINPA